MIFFGNLQQMGKACLKSLKVCIKSDFEEIIFKLATYGQREKAFLCHKVFGPNGLSAPAWGYIHVKKHIKKPGKKSDFKRFF